MRVWIGCDPFWAPALQSGQTLSQIFADHRETAAFKVPVLAKVFPGGQTSLLFQRLPFSPSHCCDWLCSLRSPTLQLVSMRKHPSSSYLHPSHFQLSAPNLPLTFHRTTESLSSEMTTVNPPISPNPAFLSLLSAHIPLPVHIPCLSPSTLSSSGAVSAIVSMQHDTTRSVFEL